MAHLPFGSALFWPMMAAMSASEATSAFVHQMARMTAADVAMRPEVPRPEWTTRNRLTLELPTLLLRNFSLGDASGAPTMICAPYALHGATVADFAPDHSLVEVLLAQGRTNLHVVEWRSATPQMRLFTIDTLLADLNVAVDEVGEPVDLVGLCQGGWMALLYAARFPWKVRRLVIAGAPIDIAAGESGLSRLASRTPVSMFAELLKVGDGRLLGQMMLDLWGPAPAEVAAIRHELQIEGAGLGPPSPQEQTLHRRFRDWYDWTVDLPGIYYLEVVQWLYKENRLAQGTFFALGRRIDLAEVKLPILLLAGAEDKLIAPQQVLSTERLVGTAPADVKTIVTPSSHLGLFMGRRCLGQVWPEIVDWLAGPVAAPEPRATAASGMQPPQPAAVEPHPSPADA
ncbi:MAG: alpha/beta fold hydrolase [Xanthobacteraceae bacterium]